MAFTIFSFKPKMMKALGLTKGHTRHVKPKAVKFSITINEDVLGSLFLLDSNF